jgi:DNA-binding HxlR family transcriptional regulator
VTKHYDQFCGVARALEVLGERWTLLIVRELLTGPKRFSDLRSGLGPIAPTVLTQRLRSLEDHGVVERAQLWPGAGVPAYSLTPRGEELRPVILALGRWGTPLLGEARPDDTFSARWLLIQLADSFQPPPEKEDVTIEFRIGDEVVHTEVRSGELNLGEGPTRYADHVVESPIDVFAHWGLGQIDTAEAEERGLMFSRRDTPEVLRRLFRTGSARATSA